MCGGLAGHASATSSGTRGLAAQSRSPSVLVSFSKEQTIKGGRRWLEDLWPVISIKSTVTQDKKEATAEESLVPDEEFSRFQKTQNQSASWRIPASNSSGSETILQFQLSFIRRAF